MKTPPLIYTEVSSTRALVELSHTTPYYSNSSLYKEGMYGKLI